VDDSLLGGGPCAAKKPMQGRQWSRPPAVISHIDVARQEGLVFAGERAADFLPARRIAR